MDASLTLRTLENAGVGSIQMEEKLRGSALMLGLLRKAENIAAKPLRKRTEFMRVFTSLDIRQIRWTFDPLRGSLLS